MSKLQQYGTINKVVRIHFSSFRDIFAETLKSKSKSLTLGDGIPKVQGSKFKGEQTGGKFHVREFSERATAAPRVLEPMPRRSCP